MSSYLAHQVPARIADAPSTKEDTGRRFNGYPIYRYTRRAVCGCSASYSQCHISEATDILVSVCKAHTIECSDCGRETSPRYDCECEQEARRPYGSAEGPEF